jgi:hypothetical protein
MPQQDLLKHVVARLDEARIEYMLTGSVVSSLQGKPRATHGIGIVIALRTDASHAMRALKSAFAEARFHFDEDAMRIAIDTHTMFNVVDTLQGDQVDLWFLTPEAFDQSRFQRRILEQFEGARIAVSAPEDTILMKLKWSALPDGGEKHFVDALRVYEVQRGALDQAYLDAWAPALGVTPLLARLREEAAPTE